MSLVVAGIVVSGLLYVVVEITKIDKREATLDQVQRDMKRAIDYITDDLQEAVYVYGDSAKIQELKDELKDDPKFPDTAVPVLAFWRIDPLDGIPKCTDVLPAKKQLCNVLRIRQAAYTLVVYSQQTNNNNSNWPGQSRIIRYELSRYSSTGLSSLTERIGYRDPASTIDPDASFENWIADIDGTPAGDSAVLVDFVATPTPNPPFNFNKSPLSDLADDGSSSPCFSYSDPGGLYVIVPSGANVSTNHSFFACVRNPDPDNNPETTDRANQDIYVFLRGSVQGASGGVNFFSKESSLPILETRVLVKGIIDKNLQN